MRKPIQRVPIGDGAANGCLISSYAIMDMKLLIWTGIVAGGGLGAWIGSTFDQSDFLGFWSIILGGVGSLLGIWAGYRLGKYMGY